MECHKKTRRLIAEEGVPTTGDAQIAGVPKRRRESGVDSGVSGDLTARLGDGERSVGGTQRCFS